MFENGSRKAERLISLGLIVATSLGAYALGAHHRHDHTASKPKVATPHPRKTPKNSTVHLKVTAIKKSHLEPPVAPIGGDYNLAGKAAADVTDGNSNVIGAEKLLSKITDPTIKQPAVHAVQTGIAELAAYDVTNGNSNVTGAEKLLGKITLPDVRVKAVKSIDEGLAELAAYKVSNGSTDVAGARRLEAKMHDTTLISQVDKAISQEQSGNTNGATDTWANLYDESANGWSDLYDQANEEHFALDLHTDGYKRFYDQAQ